MQVCLGNCHHFSLRKLTEKTSVGHRRHLSKFGKVYFVIVLQTFFHKTANNFRIPNRNLDCTGQIKKKLLYSQKGLEIL